MPPVEAVLPKRPDPRHFTIAANVHLPNTAARVNIYCQRTGAIIQPDATIEAGGLTNPADCAPHPNHIDLIETALRQIDASDLFLDNRTALLQRRVAFLTRRSFFR